MSRRMTVHTGDMNNFTVANEGTAKTTIGNARCRSGDGANSFASGGSALIVADVADSERPTRK